MCLTANEQNVQAVNQAPLCFATMKTTPVYYLFSKLKYFIITRCLVAGVAGGGVRNRGQRDQ